MVTKRIKLGSEDGEEKKIEVTKKPPGTLTQADNQRRVRYETDIGFKLLDKAGSMEKDTGVSCADWTIPANRRFVTMLRGEQGCVQTYDSLEGTTSTVNYSGIEGKVKGLHTIIPSSETLAVDAFDDLSVLP